MSFETVVNKALDAAGITPADVSLSADPTKNMAGLYFVNAPGETAKALLALVAADFEVAMINAELYAIAPRTCPNCDEVSPATYADDEVSWNCCGGEAIHIFK